MAQQNNTRGALNWKQWLGNGKGCVVGKLGGIQKNKWQWRVLNVDGENCTYCDPKPGAKLNGFTLRGATVRMVDNKSAMHRNFLAMKIEGVHPERKTIENKTFIAVLMPKDQKYVFMVEESDSKLWMMILNQKEFPMQSPVIQNKPIAAPVAKPVAQPAATPAPAPTPVVAAPKPATTNVNLSAGGAILGGAAVGVGAGVGAAAMQKPNTTQTAPVVNTPNVQQNFNQGNAVQGQFNQQPQAFNNAQGSEYYEQGGYYGEDGEWYENGSEGGYYDEAGEWHDNGEGFNEYAQGEHAGEFEGGEYGEHGGEFAGENGEWEGAFAEGEGEWANEGEWAAEGEYNEGEYAAEGEYNEMGELNGQFNEMNLQGGEGQYFEGEGEGQWNEGEYYEGEQGGEYYNEEYYNQQGGY